MTQVLLVEDDQALSEILAEFLLEEGHAVTIAPNGRQALDLLKRAGHWMVLEDSAAAANEWPGSHSLDRSPSQTRRGALVMARYARWAPFQDAHPPRQPSGRRVPPQTPSIETKDWRSSVAASKRGKRRPPCHTSPRTLRSALEELIRLGADYVVVDRETEWTARELLTWLEQHHPARLGLPMYLRIPDAQQDGAICQLTRSGGFLVLYHIAVRTGWN